MSSSLATEPMETLDVGASSGGSRFLVVRLASETYAIDIGVVREIIQPIPVTRLPRAPHHILGVMNLRGKILTVVDLRRRLRMPPMVIGGRTVFVVLHYPEGVTTEPFAVVADEVLEVVMIDANGVDMPPEVGESSPAGAFLQGIGRSESGPVFLLDLASAVTAGGRLAGTGTANA